MYRAFASLWLMLGLGINPGFSQENTINREGLNELLIQIQDINRQRTVRVDDYLKGLTPVARSRSLNNRGKYIYDVQNGKPLFIGLDNAEAAEAIGIPSVQAGGSLGLNLNGEGMEVGVWDGGAVRTTHQELAGRIVNLDNPSPSSFDQHATNVTAVIMASGVRGDARGMAPSTEVVAYSSANDEEEMVNAQLQRELLLSNHSYNLIAGWDDGTWVGDVNISDVEDWRFGYYDGRTRLFDEIAYNSPNYLIVNSAGNNRGDAGDGTFPPDGPFDIIPGTANAKNTLVVGAITKSTNGYNSPEDINISSFSGFGPTDDGRIKPDIVGVGVNVFTANSNSDSGYNFTSGTSFSAPSVTGGLLLLQQLYKQQTNTFMRSATLKGLAIQTAKEAGSADGPDYRYGWGLLDVESAADLLIRRDGDNVQVIEDRLNNRQEYLIELNPVAGSTIKATLTWTDLPGSPPSIGLDRPDLMLVNDLDMRIVDEANNEFQPWIMDPSNPNDPATTGDNFRDNIEQIVAKDVEPRKYFIQITHKGSLQSGPQEFSLIVDYESENTSLTSLYWIGGSGTWSDESNWSATSGGPSASVTPQTNNRLIFDDNSFVGSSATVVIDQDFEVGGISAFTEKNLTIDLSGRSLVTTGPLLMSPSVQIQNGTIICEDRDEGVNTINLDGTTNDNFTLHISEQNVADWTIVNSSFAIESLIHNGGLLDVGNSTINVQVVDIGSSSASSQAFNLTSSSLADIDRMTIASTSTFTDSENSSISFTDADEKSVSEIDIQGQTLLGTLNFTLGNFDLSASNSDFNTIIFSGASLNVNSNLEVNGYSGQSSGALNLSDGVTVTIKGDLFELAPNSQINGVQNAKGTINIESHNLYCFDNLSVANVDLEGNSSVTLGNTGNISNSENWALVDCNDLVFSDFNVDFACANGLSNLINLSNGNIVRSSWFVNGEFISDEFNAIHSFELSGINEVTLEVVDGLGLTSEWTQEVEIALEALDSNYIVQNSSQLASFKLADSYQWYKNGEPIPGAVNRVLPFDGENAVYFVVTFGNGCNRKSTELDLSTSVINVDTETLDGVSIDVSPIPASDRLVVKTTGLSRDEVQFRLVNLTGQTFIQRDIEEAAGEYTLDITAMNSGVYLLTIQTKEDLFTKKIIIQH